MTDFTSTDLTARGTRRHCIESSPFRSLNPGRKLSTHNLSTPEGNITFDEISGRLRFFGPTANSHVYTESLLKCDWTEVPEPIRHAEQALRCLSHEAHAYLMQCFWDYYNNVLQVVDKQSFEANQASRNPKFYSLFLHITILAAGWRFADKNREDMKLLDLGNRESMLHREAKFLVDVELERPGGIPSVQAFLLLGDLECGIGRDNTGWVYSGPC